MKKLRISLLALIALGLYVACGGESDSDDAAPPSSGGSTTCSLVDNTTESTTESSVGCFRLVRDSSSCQAAREAQGLSGFWLKFSCRVDLTVSGSNVVVAGDAQPDYKSWYFDTSDACYEDATLDGRRKNPHTIAAYDVTMTVPMTPTTNASNATGLGAIGLAVNGVTIYNNEAAPGDSIYDEVESFDICEGHSDGTRYHYHTEPPSISNEDDNFVGVMRDGNPIYGRFCNGATTVPTDLDANGGHTTTTVDSTNTALNHYHVHAQTDGTNSAFFISAGSYAGSEGACTGCM